MSGAPLNNILIPQVTKLPNQKSIKKTSLSHDDIGKSEFNQLLKDQIKDNQNEISLSTHAAKRIQERNLNMDKGELQKLSSAFKKLETKGGQDSLIITENAAYIVDVPNRKVVTAMDKENLLENVFTKIDSTIMVWKQW